MARKRKNPRTKSGKASRPRSAARLDRNDRPRRRKPTSVPDDATKTSKANRRKGTQAEAGENGDGAQAAAPAPDELNGALQEEFDVVAEEGITARQPEARAQRGPSRRSDSSNTDDGRAQLIARVLSAKEGTPEREEAMRELALHQRRHQPMPSMATPERDQAEKLVADADREQKLQAAMATARELEATRLPIERRVEMITDATVTVLSDPVLARHASAVVFSSLHKADGEGYREFTRRVLVNGLGFSGFPAMEDQEEAVANMLRPVAAEESGSSSVYGHLLGDELLNQWVVVARLRRRAEAAYRAGGKDARRDYTRLMETLVKATQGLTALMGELFANNQSPVRMITVEEVEPPALEQDTESDRDAPAAEPV